MSTFVALNVEPEDTVEEEIDDTKEIQIEEAFKLYQNALKLHSQGPAYYDAATEAYRELFQSEVFKYPETISDYRQEQLEDAPPVQGTSTEVESAPLAPSASADNAANSLPQLIYLAHKSRAQFALDAAHDSLKQAPASRKELYQYYYTYCLKSLQDSASALECDDTDIDLWKKSARISEVLASHRIIRFCLESVLAGDEENGEQAIDLSGLDEAYALGELDQALRIIGDFTTSQTSKSLRPRDQLVRILQKSNNPYSYLPKRTTELEYLDDRQKPNTFSLSNIIIQPASQTRLALSKAIVEVLQTYEHTDTGNERKAGVRVVLSGAIETLSSGLGLGNLESPDVFETIQPLDEPKPDHTKLGSPIPSPKSPASFHSAQDELDMDVQMSAQDVPANVTEPKEALNPEDEPLNDNNVVHAHSGIQMPTRKRSSTAAGMDEHESRTKSKRLRARESMLELAAQDEDLGQEPNQYNRAQLNNIEDADDSAIAYLDNILLKLNTDPLGSGYELRNMFWKEEAVSHTPELPSWGRSMDMLYDDMRQALFTWSDEKSAAINLGHATRDFSEKSNGLSLFLRHLKVEVPKTIHGENLATEDSTLSSFAQLVNESSNSMYEIALIWLSFLMTGSHVNEGTTSSYMSDIWSDDLKQSITTLALQTDRYVYESAYQSISKGEIRSSIATPALQRIAKLTYDQSLEFIQAMLELHLDIYVSAIGPDSPREDDFKLEQLDRVERWYRLVSDGMQVDDVKRPDVDGPDTLRLRFIWASTKLASLIAGDDKSHIILCLNDLRTLLDKAGDPTIILPNNVAIPLISVSAVEQEISQLTTLDFFMSVFDGDSNDAAAVILKLEPILEPDSLNNRGDSLLTSNKLHNNEDQITKLRAFLDSGTASLKLFLWRRLQNAYTAISYSPKVISCLLRSCEIIANELRGERHAELTPAIRQATTLQWLQDVDSLISRVLNKVIEDPEAFETFDEKHLKSSIEATVFILRLVHAFVLFDDSVRVGRMSNPVLRPSSAKQFEKAKDKLRDLYVRLWTLLFYLLKEATVQLPDEFETPARQLADYLSNVHTALGSRQYCKHCNKMFVKLAKTQLLTLRTDVDYYQDLAQILYDMYQLKFGSGVGGIDHGCTPELLRDKTTAITLVPIVMMYAKLLNMRDLIKSDLKATIDKIQQCLGSVKAVSNLSFNRRVISSFLKSHVNPQAIYRSMNGIGDLTVKSVQGDTAKIASTGWYMLLGKMSLAKFKSIKRVNPTATDDLDTAATFLRHDLEHNIINWESWYRLAQVYDAKIEDSLIWNATKINEARMDLATLERSAINAYSMAITMAIRSADDAPNTVQCISDMYCEFAFRLYASSRPPLDMEAFKTDKHQRHISNSMDQTMSKEPFVMPFKKYAVWSFAANLLRRKFKTSEKEWFCHYTLGKCLWKMYQSSDNARAKRPVTLEQVLDAFSDAIELCPKKEKSSDYVLEPHYKLASVVHKLVHRKILEPVKGIEVLQVTQFSKGAKLTEDEQGRIEWEPYILDVLKKIGHADKSNWHHRITARAAHVTYDDDPTMGGALGARHQFTQQIFTKTMTMQVWKPENERAGRHYVYTGRYLEFFVHLLDLLNDRENLEQLVRRIRRKTTDFLDHPKIWEQTATTYVKLMRRIAKIPEGHERAVFDKISHEEFTKISEKVEKWTHDQEIPSIFLETIIAAIELKKLNNSLMKGPAIDDLIGDAYASMYEDVVSQLPTEEVIPAAPSSLPQGTFVNMTTEIAPTGDDNLDRMRLNNLLSNQVDGTAGFVAIPTAISGSLTSGLHTPSRATPPVDPVRIPTPNKPGRVKTITRREVQRKAEAATNRPQAVKTPVTGKKIVVEIPSIRRNGSNSSKPRGSVDEDDAMGGVNDAEPADSRPGSERQSAARSPRKSASPSDDEDDKNNDGDDESELSANEDDAEGNEHRNGNFSSSSIQRRRAEEQANDTGDDGTEAGSDGDEEDNNDGDEDNEDEEDEEEGVEQDNDQEEPEDIMDVDEEGDGVLEIEDSQDIKGDDDSAQE